MGPADASERRLFEVLPLPHPHAWAHASSSNRCPQGDFPAAKMIDSIPGVDPARKARLIKALDVDIAWRMHQVPPPHPGSIQG